jgi:LysR family transcriptional activator of nhaA
VVWLNYHHLLYFYTVARAGTMVQAAEELQLSQPTLSSQIALLERQIGEKLFRRAGRRLELTEAGRVAYRYAEEIFTLGREMLQGLRGQPSDRPLRLVVGAADVLPKLVVFRLLEPVLALPRPVQFTCLQGKLDGLLTSLIRHEIDVVLTDAPASSAVRPRVFNHLLGECGITVFGTPALAGRYRLGFPNSLADAPWLLPLPGTALRRSLEEWFGRAKLPPRPHGEFADSALLKVFGQAGAGVFAMPTAIEGDVIQKFGVEVIGRADGIRERAYAVTAERRLEHPAVQAISASARNVLFAS